MVPVPLRPTRPAQVRWAWLAAALILMAGGARAQGDPHQHHHPLPDQPSTAPEPRPRPVQPDPHSHSHGLGPAGRTYDLRWLDAMVQHHTGALRMSERVFNIGQPGIGALARTIWSDQLREIQAMGQWRRAWYPEAPVHPVVLGPGGDPDSMAGLERMSVGVIEAMRMMGTMPTRDNRVTWFLEGMLHHHGGALEMAHDALAKSRNPTIRRLARQIIVAQRREILELRRMLRHDGRNRPEIHRYDALFSP